MTRFWDEISARLATLTGSATPEETRQALNEFDTRDIQAVRVSEGGGGGSQAGARRTVGPFTYQTAWGQKVYRNEEVDGGTFKLTYDGTETTALVWDIDGATLQAALEVIPSLTGKVTCDGGPGPGPLNIGIYLDHSIDPPLMFEMSNNSLTFSAAPVTDVGINCNVEVETDLLLVATGDILWDMFVQVPAGFAIDGATWLEDADDLYIPDGTLALTSLEDDGSFTNFSGQKNTPINTAKQQDEADGYGTFPAVCLSEILLQWCVGPGAGQTTNGIVHMYLELSTPEAP